MALGYAHDMATTKTVKSNLLCRHPVAIQLVSSLFGFSVAIEAAVMAVKVYMYVEW